MKILTVVIALFAVTCINAQSVGIGTETPNAPLHIKSAAATEVLRIEGNNPNISFYNNALGYRGYLCTHTTGIELGSPTGSGLPVIIAPGFTPIGYFTTSGRVGLGISNPVERLDLSGNINLNSSLKGIILNAADRPFITRGFDAFTSGNYTGLGRWGLFMEPSRLTLGIPNIAGKAFNVSAYDANSSVATTLFSVSQDGTTHVEGEVNRPSKTGSTNLLPIAYGNVTGSTGAIKTGSGNFTVARTSTGAYTIEIVGESYTIDTHVVNITTHGISARFSSTDRNTFFSTTGIRVIIWNSTISPADADFSFIVYKP